MRFENGLHFFNEKLYTIVWKNIKERQRKVIATFIFESVLPISIVILLSHISKTTSDTMANHTAIYNSIPQAQRLKPSLCFGEQPLISAGILDWLQGSLCTSKTTCRLRTFNDMNFLDLILKNIPDEKYHRSDLYYSYQAFASIFCGNQASYIARFVGLNLRNLRSTRQQYNCNFAKLILSDVNKITRVFEQTIYYYPNHSKMRQLVKKIEEMFQKILLLKKAAKDWRELYSLKLAKHLANSTTKENIAAFIASCINDNKDCTKQNSKQDFCRRMLTRCKTLEMYRVKLGEWNTFISVASVAFSLAESLIDCITFPKFVAAVSKDDLYTLSHKSNLSVGLIIDGFLESTTLNDVGHLKLTVVKGNVEEVKSKQVVQTDISTVSMVELFTRNLIEVITNKTISEGVTLRRLLNPCFVKQFVVKTYMKIMHNLVDVLLIVCWMPSFCFTIVAIVSEKEKRLTFTLQLMSVTKIQLWFGWFVHIFPLFALLSTATVFCFDIFGVIQYSSLFLFFIILIIYSITCILQCFFISTIFHTSRVASIAAPMLYLFGTIIRFTLTEKTPKILFWIMTLIPQTAFYISIKTIFYFEQEEIGLTLQSLRQSTLYGSSEFEIIVTQCFSGFSFFAAMLYVEAVFPGEFGVAQLWYFPFTKRFWYQNCHFMEKCIHLNTSTPQNSKSLYFEDDPNNLTAGVEVINLVKRYSEKGPVVVNSLNLKFYVNQITAFLGHNGAGKTTTLSIIAGIFPQTSGEVIINGYNNRTDTDMALANLGLCPQHNVLFDYLTVEEHIILYSGLKGIAIRNKEKYIEKVLRKIDLNIKRKEKVTALSGGMKRRLSVGLAFLGNPTAVILDEPTAGVDPFARRQIWDVILAHKKNRAIILTTHHMDEADILGDRIAILSKGQLKCCGTSMFLKRMLGNGYFLNMCLNKNKLPNSKLIHKFINKCVPNSYLIKQTQDEITFELPRLACDNGQFQTLFEKLEYSKADLGVDNYGLNNTPLEKIFLAMIEDDSNHLEHHESEPSIMYKTDNTFNKDMCLPHVSNIPSEEQTVRKEDDIEKDETKLNNDCNDSNSRFNKLNFNFDKSKLKGILLWLTQFYAIFIKRAIGSLRGIATISGQFLVPITLLIVAIIIYENIIKIHSSTGLVVYSSKEYHPWQLTTKSNLHVFFSTESTLNSMSSRYVELMETPLGLGGVRCMNPNVYEIKDFPCVWSSIALSWATFKAPTNQITRCSMTLNNFDKWPVRTRLATTDYLYKLTKLSTEAWLHEPDDRISANRLAGFNFGKQSSPVEKNQQIEVVQFFKLLFDFNVEGSHFWRNLEQFLSEGGSSTTSVTHLWHENSNENYETAISYLGILMNIFYRSNIYRRQKDTGISIYINKTKVIKGKGRNKLRNKYIISSTLTLIKQAFTLSICTVLMFLIDERVSVSKYLQIISGIQPVLYWFANFIWDMINAIIFIVIMLCFMNTIQWKEFMVFNHVFLLAAFFILFSSAAIILMYVLSNFGSSPGKILLVVFISIELITSITEVFVELSNMFNRSLWHFARKAPRVRNSIDNIATFLEKLMVAIPHYSLKTGMTTIFEYYHNDSRFYNSTERYKDPSNRTMLPEYETILITLKPEIYTLLYCVIAYSLILITVEYSPISLHDIIALYHRRYNIAEKGLIIDDEDVAKEKYRIHNDESIWDVIQLKDITKVYTKNVFNCHKAVSNVSLGMRSGECFGLLGVNGAGKTTTFKMLTGEITPTNGKIFLHRKDIRRHKYAVLDKVGYCPQFNGFGEKFTVREVLTLHARINGITRGFVASIVRTYMDAVSLSPHADKLSGDLSGGNKRKLSTCIALIGDPDLVFLDEPTSGMDTAARRELWDIILNIVYRGKCVVLTSHSLEECEALCQRACIMVSGRLRCLGSTQHLKSKFGRGYTITLSLRKGKSLKALKKYMKKIKKAKLTEDRIEYLQYELPFSVPLSVVFRRLQTAKLERNLIDDYSINQTTLDDIFIEFAKTANDL